MDLRKLSQEKKMKIVLKSIKKRISVHCDEKMPLNFLICCFGRPFSI